MVSLQKCRASLILLLIAMSAQPAQAQLNEWWGPAVGNWSDPLNWSPFGPLPPFGSGSQLAVDADHFPGQNTVSTVDQSYTIYSLAMYAGDTVIVAGGVTLTLEHGIHGNSPGDGAFVLDPGGRMDVGGTFTVPNITVDGEMRSGSRLHSFGPLGVGIYSDIVGEGTISGDTTIMSQETISANVGGAVLRIDAPLIKFENQGTLQATGNGIMELFGKFENTAVGNFDGAGGTIALLNASTITGGTFQSSGTGRIFIGRSGPATVLCENVTNNGTLELRNSSILQVGTAMLNNGTILMSNVGAATPTLSGSTYRLTNSSTGLIRGRGNLGANELEITNNGTIEANGGGAILVIDPPNVPLDPFLNNGALRATSGGILRLSGDGGGTFINGAFGTMSAGAGATIELQNGAFIDQGTFSNGGGIVKLQTSVGTATLKGVTNAGTISTGATTSLSIDGTFTNMGWLNIGTTTNDGTASFGPSALGDATLSGGGTVTLVNELASRISGLNRLINADNLIHGAGTIGDGTMEMTNNGTIDANVAGKTLEILPPFGFSAFVNDGYMRAKDGGTMKLNGAMFFGAGTYDVQILSTLDVNATILLAGSNLNNAGTVNLNGGATVSFGSVSGAGTIIVNSGTLIANSIGQGAVVSDGTVVINSSGTLVSGISGSGTVIVKNATLAAQYIRQNTLTFLSPGGISTVQIQSSGDNTIGTSMVQSLTINFGDSLELNNNALIVEGGAYFTIRDWTLDGRIISQKPGSTAAEDAIGVAELSGTFRGQSISSVAVCVAAALRGDGDLSGTVDSVDFSYFLGGHGSTGYFTKWQYGDYNGDFAVNTGDFNYLAGNFGQTYASPALGALVPEPCVMLLAGTLLALRPWRRRGGTRA